MRQRLWFGAAQAVPEEHRSNFLHLYWDVAWFGLLAGSALAFVAVFATRQGASAFEVGLLNAGPALFGLLLTLPVGHWLGTRPLGATVFWTSVLYRVWYLAWAALPFLFPAPVQVWALIGITLVMSVPGTALSVGFNALFATAVPPEWRSHVAGTRNALVATVTIASSLFCGFLLDRLPFPLGYQVVFLLGFLGGALSSYHLWFVRPQGEARLAPRLGLRDLARPGALQTADTPRTTIGLHVFTRQALRRELHTDALRGPFLRTLAGLFAFHFAQFVAAPVFPLYMVRTLALTDQQISLGAALVQGTLALGSTQIRRIAPRLGNQRLTALGSLLMSAYPLLMALSRGVGLYLVASAVGGLAWALLAGGLGNYLLERVPENDRPTHLAWYNLALNAAILLGSFTGPLLVGGLGLIPALLVCAGLYSLAGIVILRRG